MKIIRISTKDTKADQEHEALPFVSLVIFFVSFVEIFCQ